MLKLMFTLAITVAAGAGAGAAQAASAPGRVVIGFPAAGLSQLPPRALAALPDGSLLVAGSTTPDPFGPGPDGRPGFAAVRRDGSLDPAFGSAGLAQPAVPERFDPIQVVRQPDGRLLVLGAAEAACLCSLPELAVLRLTPDGQLDQSFGSGGYAHLGGLQQPRVSNAVAALQPDGKLVVAALTGRSPATQAAVTRITSAGTFDANFGVGGVAQLPSLQAAYEVGVLASGDIAVLASGEYGAAKAASTLLRLSPVGNPDPAYPAVSSPLAVQPHMLLAPDGSVVLAGKLAGEDSERVDRFGPDGSAASEIVLGGAAKGPSHLLVLADGSAAVVDRLSAGRLRLTRLPLSGAPGAPTAIAPRFGGGTVYRAGYANISNNSFDGGLFVQRPDGSFAGAGGVRLRAEGAKGVGTTLSQFAVFSLDPSLRPDGAFGATGTHLKATVAALSRRLGVLRRTGRVLLAATLSDAGLAAVTLRAAGLTVGRIAAAVLSPNRPQLLSVPLNALGHRIAGQHPHRLKLHVELQATDLAANTAGSSVRTRLH